MAGVGSESLQSSSLLSSIPPRANKPEAGFLPPTPNTATLSGTDKLSMEVPEGTVSLPDDAEDFISAFEPRDRIFLKFMFEEKQ